MFGEDVYEGKVFHDDGYPYYTYISGFNHFVGCKYETGSNISDKTKVSIKELRNILAKEHLKEGDVFVGKNGGYKFIGVYKGFTERGLIEVSNWHNLNKDRFLDNKNNTGGFFDNFKRYATPEEIELLEPQQGLCSLCKSKLGIK